MLKRPYKMDALVIFNFNGKLLIDAASPDYLSIVLDLVKKHVVNANAELACENSGCQ